jgi:dienelactone hydrolase
MNNVAQTQLEQRAKTIAAIKDTNAAEKRKAYVRSKILELIGGLPDYRGPLNAKTTKTLDRGGYVIENVIFESWPQFYVSGNLYRPKSAGKHPAVLIAMGHWEQGKPAAQLIAANLALKGFVVLAYDPIGQGERLVGYDRRLGRSIIGGATEQHFMAGAQSILVGQSFARYRIWDGIRALDYLTSRPDVDGDRIGCTGCSGGGTLSTYISALDPRVKVAAPACYMNSFRTLFAGSVGDSEQSLPGFLSSGLDQTDYVELFAPKPWLILSTEKDFFTPAGAKQVYEEAKGWYKLYGAPEKVEWVVGPGPHGTPLKVREALYGWMIRWLKDGKGDPREAQVELLPDHALWAAEAGQVGGREVHEIIRETGASKSAAGGSVKQFISELLASNPARGGVIEITGKRGSGAQPLAILVGGSDNEAADLAAKGHVVARVKFEEPPDNKPFAGNWKANTRAWLIGHNLPAMRANTIRAAIDEAGKQAQIDSKQISGKASGVAGVSLLMAATVDERITSVSLERTPHSVKAALDTPVHRNLHDAVIPGFALRWDFKDLRDAIAPRKVVWINPTDWVGNIVPLSGAGFKYTPSDPNR